MIKINYFISLITLFHALPLCSQTTLSLEESKAYALKNNIKYSNSRLDIEASNQVKKAAFTNYFPKISSGLLAFRAKDNLFEMSVGGGTMGALKSGNIGYINVVQPVFAGGRIIAGNKLSALGEEINQYRCKLTENEILLKTEEQYWQIVSINEKMKTLQAYEELLNSLTKQVDNAYRSGMTMKNDLLKVKVKQSEIRLNKSKLENGRQLALMAFCQHIGMAYDSTLKLTDTLKIDTSPNEIYTENENAIYNRSEYLLLKDVVKAEQLQTKLKRGEYLPEVGVGVSGQYLKFDENKGSYKGLIFGTLQIPISNWWEASHTLKERSIREKIAKNNLSENTELLLLQMNKAWRDLSDAYLEVSICEESKKQAEENMKINQDSYQNGLSNLSDLLEAQAILLQVNNQLTEAKANYRIKMITYLQVTGR